jgi:iron complex outermembrane receptor protein
LTTALRRRSAARIAFGVSGQALAAALAIGAFAAPAYAQDTPPADQAADQTDDQPAIVVTGFRAALESAVAEKKNHDQVVESVSAEDIGKLPDASIAESIARLPGLTSQRISGRSNQISIRGFAPDFSTTLLNGREQTSTGDNRAVDYDQYPSEIMSQVLVYKTALPSIVGQGLAGTVDLRTVRPLEYGKRVISIGGRGSYADLGALNAGSKQYGWRVNGTYVDQFADDTIGVALSAGYLDEPYQIQEFNSWGYADGPNGTKVIGGSKSYVTSTELKRLGVMGTLEFKPSSNFTSTIDGFYSNFKDDQIKRGIELPLYWGNATLQPGYSTTGGVITQGTFTGVEGVVRNDSFQRHAKLYSFGWNNKFTTDDGWTVTADASLSMTDRNELILESYAGTGYGAGVGATDTVNFTTSETGTFFTHQLNYSDPALIVLTDPQGWGGAGNPQVGYYNNRIVHDEIHQLRGEVEKDLNGFVSSIKVGVNYTDHGKSLNPDESIVRLANGATQMALPSQFRLEPTQQAYLGLGPILSYDPTALLAAGNIYTLVPNSSPDIPAKAYDISEHLFTAYFQGNLKADMGATQLTGNFGVQAVQADQKSSGLLNVNGGYVQRTTGATYWDILPSANLSLRFPGDFVIRLAAAREMQRPRMDDMRQSLGYGVNTASLLIEGSGGNPRLRPIRANAVDLTFEKYFGTKGYVAAQFFYKDLKSFIYNATVPFDYTNYPITTGVQPTSKIGVITQPINAIGGDIKGVELAGTLPLGELVHFLDGFGLTGGVSYTDTKVIPGLGQPAEDIPGYSKWVANGTAYFEKWGFNARGSVRYRSTFVGELSGFGGNRVRRRATDETIVDAQVGYDFHGGALNGLSLYVQGQNLTDEPFVTTNPGQPLQVIDYQVYGRRFLAGASFKF